MNISENNQSKNLIKFSQVLLFDAQGFLQKSCDSIFPTHNLVNVPAYEWMPFMESIFESLLLLEVDSPEIRFTKVEVPAKFLPGYYDFTFSKVKLQDAEGILWCIFDYTDLYINLMRYQQQHNELEIHRQLFELGNQKLQHSSEIQSRKYFFQTYFKLKRTKDFYSKVNELLLSPENIFDVFNILKDESELPSSSDLQYTIEEFRAISDDYKTFLEIAISSKSNLTPFSLDSINQETQSILRQKIGQSFSIHFDIINVAAKHLIADADLLKQLLFHFAIVFFEQMPNNQMSIVFSVVSKDAQYFYLNICFSTINSASSPISIQNPTSLIIRLSLIKKLVQNAAGKIMAVSNSTGNMDITIQIPCHLVK